MLCVYLSGPGMIVKQMPCDSSPCYNGGVCINSKNNKTYTCQCPGGFTHKRCAGKVSSSCGDCLVADPNKFFYLHPLPKSEKYL